MQHSFKTYVAGSLGLALIVWLAGASFGQVDDEQKRGPEGLLKALEEIRFDLKHVYRARDLSIRRDAITLNFDRGRIIFLEPVNGLVTGLLFWGQGTLVAVPPHKIEKQQLNFFTGSPALSERFGEAFLRFSDDTHKELAAQLSASEEEPIDESAGLTQFQQLLRREVLSNYRVLADLLDGRKAPMFSGKVAGGRLGIIDLVYDPRKTEAVHIGQFNTEHERTIYNSWCSYSRGSTETEGTRDATAGKLIDVRHYLIDTEIDRNDRLSGTTEAEFRCEQNDGWMLTFDLSRFLKVSKIEDEQGRSLRFFQNSEMTKDEEISRLGHDVVIVLMPNAMRRGDMKKLKFTYSGEVISRLGSGVFYVGSRGSWYPNLGTTDRARYTLTFKHPKPFTIVATGDLVKAWEEGDRRCSLWTAQEEVPVAGFNYGDYNRTVAPAGPVQVEVYANRGIENVYQEVIGRMEYVRAMQRQQAQNPRNRRAVNPPPNDPFPVMPNFLDFDTTRFAREISTQVVSTLAFFEKYLGQYPYRKLAVSQIPGRFSQGWPSLLYASSLSFLSPSQRTRLGLEGDREAFYLECLHAHEIAHQWWGNQLGWKSYHDLWMFEGFSTYLAYLSLREKYPEGRQFADLLRFGREKLLDKNSDGQTLESAGPIWLGARLSSSKFRFGYGTLVYEKGAWVLHMLRYLFSDPVSGSDQPFRTLMRDFVASHAGGLVGSADFQKIVNKHMPRTLDLEGNRTLDWFFDQWVYETGIPTYRLDSTVTAVKSGGFVLKGKIKQENVSEYFMMPVEVFGHFGPDKVTRIGRVVVSGKETDFRFTLKTKPLKVTLDENQQVLCENETL